MLRGGLVSKAGTQQRKGRHAGKYGKRKKKRRGKGRREGPRQNVVRLMYAGLTKASQSVSNLARVLSAYVRIHFGPPKEE